MPGHPAEVVSSACHLGFSFALLAQLTHSSILCQAKQADLLRRPSCGFAVLTIDQIFEQSRISRDAVDPQFPHNPLHIVRPETASIRIFVA